MVSLLGLTEFLQALSHDPVAFSVVFFLYSVAATVFLPIPVEPALFFSPETPFVVKALLLGAGKALGSVMVFYLGDKIGGGLEKRVEKSRKSGRLFDWMERFVGKTRYLGLYLLLSTPFMFDTIILYVFALFNQQGVLHLRYFVLTNFLGGITRACIIYPAYVFLGITLF